MAQTVGRMSPELLLKPSAIQVCGPASNMVEQRTVGAPGLKAQRHNSCKSAARDHLITPDSLAPWELPGTVAARVRSASLPKPPTRIPTRRDPQDNQQQVVRTDSPDTHGN
mmetsp:Transcript_129048/g.413480  ORF Transcript_129048/g.413480 Transcript_129048/m.413480 type:complete len:111 (+) Transcript_129048:970-1302(+)